MKMKDWVKGLKEHRLLGDGAFGTYYSGLQGGAAKIPEWDNLRRPDQVEQVHRAYIKAGARFLRANTFAANTRRLECGRREAGQVAAAGYRIARSAAETYRREHAQDTAENSMLLTAADIGPIPMDIHQTAEQVIEEYRYICDAFLSEGADLFLFETFADMKYIEPVILWLKEKSDAAVFVSFCVNGYGYSKYGIPASRLLEDAARMEEIDGIGFNCGIGPGHLWQVMSKLQLPEDKIITAFPNSGYPALSSGRTDFKDTRQYFGQRMNDIAELGVNLLGGCCGTNPSYIEAVGKTVDFRQTAIRQITEAPPVILEKAAVVNPLLQKMQRGEKVTAVELDPPYDANTNRIMEYANSLKTAPVDMITFADSPMGRGRVDSILMGTKVLHETGLPVMPHIACRDKNTIALRAGLLGAYVNGIRNFLVVTGDPVAGGDRGDITGVFDFNSITLMQFLKEMNQEHFREEPICYGGALNQGRKNLDAEIRRMEKKIEAGASYFLTQPIFSIEETERIRKIKKEVDTRILCGIMPLVSYRNACFIRNDVTGIQVPEQVIQAFDPGMSKEQGEETGVRIARQMMEELKDVADGYYFMLPFNRAYLAARCLHWREK